MKKTPMEGPSKVIPGKYGSHPWPTPIATRWLLTISVLISYGPLQAQNSMRFEQVPASATEIEPLAVGEALPATALFDANGEPFDLEQAVFSKPTVLIFYRGGWCPFCNMQTGQLIKIEGQLRELGYQIIAISPDKPVKLKDSQEKWEMKYTLLSDSRMDAAIAFGIAYRVADATVAKYSGTNMDLDLNSGQDHHLLPVPAVFIIGQDAKIKYEYINPDYKVRIEPDELLRVAKLFVD